MNSISLIIPIWVFIALFEVLVDQHASYSDFETGKIFMNEPIKLKPKPKLIPKKEENDIEMLCGLFMEKKLFDTLRKHQI